MKFSLIACVVAILVFGELPTHSAEGQPTQLHWVMSQTYLDIAEIVLFAKDPKAEPSQAIELDAVPIDVRGTSKQLVEGTIGGERILYTAKMGTHPWDLEPCHLFASTLINQMGIKVNNSEVRAMEIDVPTLLLRATQTNLIELAKRVSSNLTEQPLNGRLHEQAALILGTLGLSESAGDYSDLRPVLNRMTAHLAIARATTSELGASGRLAHIIQLSLITRQVDALKLAESLPPSLAAWNLALKIRNTHDPRLLTEPNKATPLEQIEHGRALVRSYDDDQLILFLRTTKPDDLPDWGRIATEYKTSVEVGHLFSANGTQREIRAFQEAWKEHSGEKVESNEIYEKFNLPATRGITSDGRGGHGIQVLSGGNLAAFHRRHFCRAVVSIHGFLHSSMGLPAETQKWEETTKKELSSLEWYPLLASSLSSNASRRSSAANLAVTPYALAHRELVPYRLWYVLSQGEDFNVTKVSLRLVGDRWTGGEQWDGTWFRRTPMFSTTPNDLNTRAAMIKNLQDTAPYHSTVLLQMANWFRDRASPPSFQVSSTAENLLKLKELLKPIQDYNLDAMAILAEAVQTTDPTEYIQRKQAICRLDPNSYFKLGDALVATEKFDEAAAAYQSGVDKATDRVSAANNVEWLVNYYFDHDRKSEAQKIADEAARVYSLRGLKTKAHLAERLGNLEEAESLYQAIDQRYPASRSYLWNFWWRFKDQSETYSKAWQDLIQKNLPGGLKEVKIEGLKGEPNSGVHANTSPAAAVYGVNNGSILVAIDGYQVANLREFEFISELRMSKDGVMRCIFWTGKAYRDMPLGTYGRISQIRFSDSPAPKK